MSLSLIVFAASRLVTFLMAYAITTVSGPSLTDVLARWDGGWYLAVVQRGYPDAVADGSGVAAQSTIAFFPGYPLLIKAGSSVTGLSLAVIGVVISTLTGAAASVVLWLLAARVTDAKSANRTVVLFCFFPAAFVLSMVYAEALFVLLVAGCLLMLMLERWAVAGLAAAFAGLVRPNGLVLTACCGWAAIQAIRRHGSWRPNHRATACPDRHAGVPLVSVPAHRRSPSLHPYAEARMGPRLRLWGLECAERHRHRG